MRDLGKDLDGVAVRVAEHIGVALAANAGLPTG
jgi:hypothetical protein